MNYKRMMKRRRFFYAFRIWGIVILSAAAIIVGAFFIYRSVNGPIERAFLASDRPSVNVYYYDDYEHRLFVNNTDFVRGMEVAPTGETYTENGREYVQIYYDGEYYYVETDSLVKEKEDVIYETELFVRTSVTLYEGNDTSEIAGFVKKGERLEITGYTEMLDDGSIKMYEVKASDGQSGWVYSKYLVNTQDEADAINEKIYSMHQGREFSYDLHGGSVSDVDWYPYEKPDFENNPIIQDARGMYIALKAVENIDQYLSIASSSGVNTIVLDIKDGGFLCPLDTVKEYCPSTWNSYYTTYENAQKLVQKIKDAGMYLILRIVVFKDTMYGTDHEEHCIASSSSTGLWPSAFSRDVWEYNVKLAEEVIDKFSPNEIQFDYVRFPENAYSLSEDATTDFRNDYDEAKVEAVQNFLYYACDRLHEKEVYVSADVFAECAGKYVSAYGQYFSAISNIVDAISGMPYTDHYGTETDTWTDGYTTVNGWAEKAVARNREIETPAIIRTWLTCYNVPNWDPQIECDANYLGSQAQGLYDAGATGGFMTWNSASNLTRYENVKEAWGRDYGYGTGGYNLANVDNENKDAESSSH